MAACIALVIRVSSPVPDVSVDSTEAVDTTDLARVVGATEFRDAYDTADGLNAGYVMRDPESMESVSV